MPGKKSHRDFNNCEMNLNMRLAKLFEDFIMERIIKDYVILFEITALI